MTIRRSRCAISASGLSPRKTSIPACIAGLSLTSFDLNTSDVTFPPGYIEALRYNLAVQLMAEMPGDYNQATFGIVTAKATETMARVRSINIPLIQSFCDPAVMNTSGYYNYYADLPVGGRRNS